jgi:hypothetical protein
MGEPYRSCVFSVFSAGLPMRVSVAHQAAVLHADWMFFSVETNGV